MRIAPVGVFYHNNPERLRAVAHESSRITHAHRLGKEGAALQAYAVALAVNLDPPAAFDRSDFLAKLAGYTQDAVYQEKLSKIKEFLNNPDRARIVAELGHGIEAFNSVPTAIFSFLAYPDSFTRAVFHAISLGGDNDTIGAMTGAIPGAYLGIESIPASWRNKLENRRHIEELAQKLWVMWKAAYQE